MKFTAFAVPATLAVASVVSATDYQSALRALAAFEPDAPNADTLVANPTEEQSTSRGAAAAAATPADKEHTDMVDADGKKSKEYWGGPGWGRRWGGYGWGRPWGGYGRGWGYGRGYDRGWGW